MTNSNSSFSFLRSLVLVTAGTVVTVFVLPPYLARQDEIKKLALEVRLKEQQATPKPETVEKKSWWSGTVEEMTVTAKFVKKHLHGTDLIMTATFMAADGTYYVFNCYRGDMLRGQDRWHDHVVQSKCHAISEETSYRLRVDKEGNVLEILGQAS